MSITILGLGPGDPQLLTLQARETLAHATQVWLRTRTHPAAAGLPAHLQIQAFDSLNARSNDIDAICSTIAGDIVARGEQGDVLYAVPGHPLFGEISVQRILERARARRIAVHIIPGISFVDAACAALALDPLVRGLQVADATDLARRHFPPLDPDKPVLVGQLHSRDVASDCKLTLMMLYPPEHTITLVDSAGTAEQRVRTLALSELDHTDDLGLLTALYVPPLLKPSSFNALGEIVAHLRAPQGCPWDREQTHQSLRASLLEEAYEVLEALDEEDLPHLQEELGDLLLHVLMQAQIASEAGEFLVTDVIAGISSKLVRRHPHVFGDVHVNGTDEVLANWERIKQDEKGGRKKKKPSIPRGLPALTMAAKVSTRSKRQANPEEVAEQVRKLKRTRNRGKALGEILLALSAYAAGKGVDPESALRSAATRAMKKHAAATNGDA